MTRRTRILVSAAVALTMAGVVTAITHAQQPAPGGEWRAFAGSWTATGRRQTLPTDGGGFAAVIQLSGNVALQDAPGVPGGFTGELLAFDDGQSISVGRAVWTDSHGDRVFSALHGEPIVTGRRVTATITGGTGRYAGIVGEYQLTWQYVVRGEGDDVQGRAVDLKGRFRSGEARR